MNLQLILGGSGSGKTYFLQETLCKEAMEHPEKTYLLIVPEQFTLETQRELVQKQKGNAIMNIDVLSFLRLAWRVFEELGLQSLPVLDDMGKNMVLRRVLSECRNSLHYFRGDVKKLGFLSELKSLLSEFAQYDIQEQDLERMMESASGRPMLKEKLEDARKIMKAFREFKQDRFLTAEEILARLTNYAGQSQVIRNSVLCLDGFTGFTPMQMQLLEEMFHYVNEVRVTVTMDERERISGKWDDFELFSMSKKMIFKLMETARKTGASWEIIYAGLPEGRRDMSLKEEVPYRFRKNGELGHLERMLFRYPYQKYQKVPEQISLSVAANPEEEIWSVLRKIKKLSAKYRYRDIAVITGDIAEYAQIASSCFKKAGIPFFMDYKKNILSNPYVEFLRSFLAMLDRDFSYEAVFRHLGNGLVPLNKDEKDRMENYVLASGVRGRKKWRNDWNRAYSEAVKEELPQLNRLREKLMELMRPAAGMLGYDLYEDRTEEDTIKIEKGTAEADKNSENQEEGWIFEKRKIRRKRKRTVLDYVNALYAYSNAAACEEKLWAYEAYFREQGEHALEREYAQVYKKVMELLERMAELLGGEVVTLKEFMELFDAGIAEVKIGLIPPGLDQVIIGDLERTRLNHLKVLFFIGLNDGIVPKAGGKGGILSDLEREYLSSHDFELAPTQRELGYRGQFYLYLALTKPDSLLYLSYCRMNQSCDALRPSYLLRKIQSVFPYLEEREEGKALPLSLQNGGSLQQISAGDASLQKIFRESVHSVLGADSGDDYFLKGLRSFEAWDKMPAPWKGLFFYYRDREPEKLRRLIFSAMGGNGTVQLPANVARQLYGRNLYGSVTRFEQYASCQYAHFLSYGLRLKERQEFMLRSVDIGNIFHRALCIFGRKASAQEGGWHGFAGKEEHIRVKMTEESLSEAILEEDANFRENSLARALLNDSARNRHIFKRIEKMMQRTTEILVYQMQKGAMEPIGYEIRFGENRSANSHDGSGISGLGEGRHDNSLKEELSSTRISLSEQEAIFLRGQIDRLDAAWHAVRVVDYKTGKKEFLLEDVYYGLQMQLMVYLKVGMEAASVLGSGQNEGREDLQESKAGQGENAAGAYYYRIDDPFVKKKEPDGDEWKQQLKMNGVSNKKEDMVSVQDNTMVEQGEFVPSARSDVIPFAVTSKREIDSRCTGVMDGRELTDLMDYVQDMMAGFGREILDGHVERNPYKKTADDTACRYCNYREMCNPKDPMQQGGFRYLSKDKVPPDISQWERKWTERASKEKETKQDGKESL